MPAGTVKRVGSLTCSLLLFVAVVRPILRADYSLMLSRWENAYAALAAYDDTLEQTDISLLEQLISQQSSAYIESKAESEGLSCHISIRCRLENGLPIPDRADVSGSLEMQQQALISLIHSELDIAPENIAFLKEKGGPP